MNYAHCRQFFSKFFQKTLLIGFSGGADSTALLEVVRDLQGEFGYTFTAIHFNHHLRGAESDQEARNARVFCAERNIPFRLIDLDVERTGNLENAAREARLAAWQRLVPEYHADAVLLAHHADDRLENLLLRLSRGANTSGATSLRAVTKLSGITFCRPLLDFTKEELVDFLAKRQIRTFAEDSSNHDCHYLRNNLRHRILPTLYAAAPGGKTGFLAALETLETDARYLEDAAEKYFRSGDPTTLLFWQQAPTALRPRLLRQFIQQETESDFLPTGGDCRRLDKELERSNCEIRRVTLSGGITLILTHDDFSLEMKEPPQVIWNWQEEQKLRWGNWQIFIISDDGSPCMPNEARFDAAALPCPLVIAAPLPGETMIPFGRDSEEKLKKLRIDRKSPAYPPLPVVHDKTGKVLWFAGVRQSNAFPVTASNRTTVRFCAEKLPLFQHKNSTDGK